MTMATDKAGSAVRTVPAARDHFVHFYEEDAELVGQVARFIRNGLEGGCGAIVICTPEHRAAIEREWSGTGFDAAPPTERGQLLIRDAAETLGLFMDSTGPDAERFDAEVGTLVCAAVSRWGEVVAFGEMVALLWQEGRRNEAIELENLWNELGSRQRFALYCGYPLAACASAESVADFHRVCNAHAHQMPSRPFDAPSSEADQMRLLSELRQKTMALEHELLARREAEERLRQREAELSDFLENGVVGLHRVGPDGRILWANRAELDLLGYEPAEYIGHHIGEFHADAELVSRILQTLSCDGVLKDQPARMRCKDGTLKHVLINSNAQMDGGRFVATRCFTRDVSDRWLAQEALRERGAVLHLALQGSRTGYWIGDLHANTVRCSPELADLLGASGPIDGPLDTFIGLMNEEDRPRFSAALTESITQHRMLSCEFRVRREGGAWRWFEARGEAVYENGFATRFYGICSDVTARRHDEHRLEHYAAVIDSAQDAILSKTLEGTILSWNRAAERLLGYRADEIVGRSIRLVIPERLHDEEGAIVRRLRQGETIERYATERLAKDGTTRRVSLTVSPVRNRDGRIIGASTIAVALP